MFFHKSKTLNTTRYKGFTLAETLITLVIVGVIAAITVPVIIAKSQEQQIKTQFKKTFSLLTQAIYQANSMDFGGQAECYYGTEGSNWRSSDDCRSFLNAMVKKLQVSKVCNNNAKNGGCIPEYKNYVNAVACPNFNEDRINNTNSAYILSNGQIIIFYGNISTSNTFGLFLVDVNGFKGPNKQGYDLFDFDIGKRPTTGLYLKEGRCQNPQNGGKNTKNMIKEVFTK